VIGHVIGSVCIVCCFLLVLCCYWQGSVTGSVMHVGCVLELIVLLSSVSYCCCLLPIAGTIIDVNCHCSRFVLAL
jgi:hypothetical protein